MKRCALAEAPPPISLRRRDRRRLARADPVPSSALPAQWKHIALELDALLGLNQWKQSAPNAYYDAPLVRRVLRALREFRARDDVEGVCAVLHACVRNNFAGVESFRLYSESYYGTKNLVQEYLDEGERASCLSSLAESDATGILADRLIRGSLELLGVRPRRISVRIARR